MAKDKKLYAFDCETDPFKYERIPSPYSWGIYGADDYQYFWGDNATEQFIEHICDFDNCILYAHNGGKFDFFYLLPWLDPDIFIINGRIAKATINNGAIELRDSWLILPMPLKVHGKLEIDYEKMERENREKHKKEILNYLYNDCRSLYDWVYQFREKFGTKLTLASTAFSELKKTDYNVTNTYDSFDQLFRNFYHGGRVQCFQVGAFYGKYKYLDIKSAYPFAMLTKHWHGSQYKQVLKLPNPSKNGSWFAHIYATSYGALPFKHDNKMYFPDDGEPREYFVSGWEINAGIETGTLKIHKVLACYVPLFTAHFREYVNKFYAMKEEAEKNDDKTGRQFAKLLLTNCYGKFGQDGREFEKYTITGYGEVPAKWKDKTGIEHSWDHYAISENLFNIWNHPDPVDYFYNVATAASITGFVRAYLWRSICKADNVLYCDTDSIICIDYAGETGTGLGDWEIEPWSITEAYIAQRKMYALKTDSNDPKKQYKVASKGVRLSFDNIKSGVLLKRNITYEKDAPAFSLKYGARFFDRTVDFENLEKNACNNPPK